MKCLIVEDEKDFYQIEKEYLEKLDFQVDWAKSSKEAEDLFKRKNFDLIILDIELKEETSGLDLISNFKKFLVDLIVITGHIQYEEKLTKLYKDGIILDYFIKPINFEIFYHRLNILKNKYSLKEEFEIPEKFGIVGISKGIKEVINKINLVSKKDLNVYIEGETGTGKELVARAIHKASKREGNFVEINCSAIPESIAEA